MTAKSINNFDGTLVDAFACACAAVEPVFIPATTFADDRGWSVMNQLQGVLGPQGQINYSLMYPNIIKAWHRHFKQTDFWLCLLGHLKAGIYRDDGRMWRIVLGEQRPGVLIIPPPLWHGARTVGHLPAGLLYYVTHAYEVRNPDEDRRSFDSVPGFSWQVEHR